MISWKGYNVKSILPSVNGIKKWVICISWWDTLWNSLIEDRYITFIIFGLDLISVNEKILLYNRTITIDYLYWYTVLYLHCGQAPVHNIYLCPELIWPVEWQVWVWMNGIYHAILNGFKLLTRYHRLKYSRFL